MCLVLEVEFTIALKLKKFELKKKTSRLTVHKLIVTLHARPPGDKIEL